MIFLVAALSLVPSGALVRVPSPGDLVAAVRSGDDVEIERVGARVGVGRLLLLAERGAKAERLAALRALPLVDRGWAVLPELARLIGDGDDEVAARAAECARRVAEGMTPEMRSREEMPGDVPARAATELLASARNAALAPALRTEAIEALAALRGVTRVDDKALAALFSDRDAQVRRAVAEGLAGGAADKALEEALAKDASAEVAAAAAASLCRDVPLSAGAKPSAAEQRAARLGAAARERLRALALDEKLTLADRLDLVGCLRVAGKEADQHVLDQLARRPPETLRRRARALGGR